MLPLGTLLTLFLGTGSAFLSRRVLDLRVNFPTYQNRRTRQVKPQHQDDDHAERAVGLAVRVEVTEINAEAEGDYEPQRDTDGRAGRDPRPLLVVEVRREVVDKREGDEHEGQHNRPLQNLPHEHESFAEPVAARDVVGDPPSVEHEYERRND